MFTQRIRRLQGGSDNIVLEIQTTDREKFFNYFKTSVLFEEMLILVGLYVKQEYIILKNKIIIINFLLQSCQILNNNWIDIACNQYDIPLIPYRLYLQFRSYDFGGSDIEKLLNNFSERNASELKEYGTLIPRALCVLSGIAIVLDCSCRF